MSPVTQIVHNLNPSYGETNTPVETHLTPMYSPMNYCEPILTQPKRRLQPANYEEINTPVETHSNPMHSPMNYCEPILTRPKRSPQPASYEEINTPVETHSTPHQCGTLKTPHSTQPQYSTLEKVHHYFTLEIPHQYSTLEAPQSTPHEYSTLEVPNTCPHKNTEGESTVPKEQTSNCSSFNNPMYEKHNKATDDDSKQNLGQYNSHPEINPNDEGQDNE